MSRNASAAVEDGGWVGWGELLSAASGILSGLEDLSGWTRRLGQITISDIYLTFKPASRNSVTAHFFIKRNEGINFWDGLLSHY